MTLLLTEKDVAEMLRLTIETIRRNRALGIGPLYLKLGAARSSPVRYRLSDVEAWLADQEVARDGAAAK